MSDTRKVSRDEEIRVNQKIQRYLKGCLEVTEKKVARGETYTPEEYFVALNEVYRLQDSIGVSIHQFELMELQEYMHKNLRKGIVTRAQIDDARERLLTNDPFKKRTDEPFLTEDSIRRWWSSLYFNMLPFVFILFLLWICQGKESSLLSLKSPLCFIFLLIVHPIYIFLVLRKWWKERAREFIAEAEVRSRKKNLFAWLSGEERRLIQRFAKGTLSFSEMKTQAEAFGHRRHYLFIALVAVIVLSISHRIIAAHTRYAAASSIETVTVHHCIGDTVDTDVGWLTGTKNSHALYEEFFDGPWDPLIPRPTAWIRQLYFLLSNGYRRSLEPVPLYY